MARRDKFGFTFSLCAILGTEGTAGPRDRGAPAMPARPTRRSARGLCPARRRGSNPPLSLPLADTCRAPLVHLPLVGIAPPLPTSPLPARLCRFSLVGSAARRAGGGGSLALVGCRAPRWSERRRWAIGQSARGARPRAAVERKAVKRLLEARRRKRAAMEPELLSRACLRVTAERWGWHLSALLGALSERR